MLSASHALYTRTRAEQQPSILPSASLVVVAPRSDDGTTAAACAAREVNDGAGLRVTRPASSAVVQALLTP